MIDAPETDRQPVMIDGMFTPEEWGDAAAIRTGAETKTDGRRP